MAGKFRLSIASSEAVPAKMLVSQDLKRDLISTCSHAGLECRYMLAAFSDDITGVRHIKDYAVLDWISNANRRYSGSSFLFRSALFRIP